MLPQKRNYLSQMMPLLNGDLRKDIREAPFLLEPVHLYWKSEHGRCASHSSFRLVDIQFTAYIFNAASLLSTLQT
jgi:hypothetical protein